MPVVHLPQPSLQTSDCSCDGGTVASGRASEGTTQDAYMMPVLLAENPIRIREEMGREKWHKTQ